MKYAIVDDCGFYYCGTDWVFIDILADDYETPVFEESRKYANYYESVEDATSCLERLVNYFDINRCKVIQESDENE